MPTFDDSLRGYALILSNVGTKQAVATRKALIKSEPFRL